MIGPEEWLGTCPMCGGDNLCAIAAGRPVKSCWCASATISAAALAAIPPDEIGKRCICESCGEVQKEDPDGR